jgi:spore coat polysaccharide biosynthesis predicted glycosyltransferase SpsG
LVDNMKILMRVDAGDKVGLGHFYRSINLADHLGRKGHEVFFVHRPSNFWNELNLKMFGFPTFPLTADYEERQLLDFIIHEKADLFFVDGILEFTGSFINNVKKHARVVFYQNTSDSFGLADIFILPAIHYPEDFFTSFSKSTTVFKGLDYFTFHRNLYKLDRIPSCSGRVKSVAVFAGGSDPNDALRKIYDLVDFKGFTEIEFLFFYGTNYTYLEKIDKSLIFNNIFRIFDHESILKCDLLISAFGVSTYEFLYLGMPIISFGHQRRNALASDTFAEMTKSIISLGEIGTVKREVLNDTIRSLAENVIKRQGLVDKSKGTLDLKGPDRVVEILEKAV